jgi:asparagine synthase (glutamine-hydrolysing)
MKALGGIFTKYNNHEKNSSLFSLSVICRNSDYVLKLQKNKEMNTLETETTFIAQIGESNVFHEAQRANLNGHLSTSLVEKLILNARGHFSLILLNKETSEIKCLSDKFNTHPLYYHSKDGEFSFSSRLKSIVQWLPEKPKIDFQAIYQYVYFHCIPSPHTIYNDVYKIQPNELISFHNSKKTISSVFSPQFTESSESSEILQKQLHHTLQQSVNESVAGIDAGSLGAFLSGGLDSSTIVGLYAEQMKEKQANSFTIGFNAEGYDETPFARATAKHFGSNHKEYYVTPEDVVAALPSIAAYCDEPFGNSSALPTYFCAKFAKENGSSVLLAGDGGDELFAGNERYAKQKVFEHYYRYPKIMGREPLGNVISLISKKTNIGLFNKAKSYIEQARIPLPERLQTYNFLNHFSYKDIFLDDFSSKISSTLPEDMLRLRYHTPRDTDALNKMLFLDWKFTLADNDLVKVSNMCAMGGVDVKYPMLSDDLVDLSMKIPSEMKLPGQNLRKFYKDTFTGFLPDSTLNKSKHGFGLPFGNWMIINSNLKELSCDALASLRKYEFFNQAFIDKLLNEHTGDHAKYYGELVWVLMMLSLWLESH